MAHCVHVILKVAFSIIRKHNAAQFTISRKVKASISGKYQQSCDIPPTNLILKYTKSFTLNTYR